jgi:hypothetical protein
VQLSSLDGMLDGHVTSIGSVVATGLRTAPVRIAVEHPPVTLRPGMYGRVQIDGTATNLTLPTEAILIKDGKESFVYVEQDRLTFARRPVVIARHGEDGRVRIVSGISPGDKVVVRGIDTLWSTAQQRRPSLVAIRQQQAAARGGLFLAQRERLPVPAFSAGTQMTQNVTGTSTFFGFSMPLPFSDRGQGAIARANAQIRAQDLALEAELAEAHADIERATTVLARRRAALNELETRVVQRVPSLRRMSEDAYREGGADILELLDAMRSAKDIQIAHVRQLESSKLAEAVVVSVAGLDAQ